MTHEMRRKDRRLMQADAEKILQESQYGVLSTCGENGAPYGVPLSYVFQEGKLYFHCATEGRKLNDLQFSPRAAFCVVGQTEVLPAQFSIRYESVVAEGVVQEVPEAEKAAVLSLIVEKYAPAFREKGAAYIQAAKTRTRVFCMGIEKLTGKARR